MKSIPGRGFFSANFLQRSFIKLENHEVVFDTDGISARGLSFSDLSVNHRIITSLRQRHGINTPLRHFVNTPLPHFVNAPLRQCVIAPKYICVIAPPQVCVTTWTSRCIMASTCLTVNTPSLPCANKCLRHYVHASLRYCVVTPGLRHTDCSRLHRVILSLFHSYRCYCRLRLRDANVSCILISPRY